MYVAMSMGEWNQWQSLTSRSQTLPITLNTDMSTTGLSEDEVTLYSLAVDDHDSNKDFEVDQALQINISDESAVSDCSNGENISVMNVV